MEKKVTVLHNCSESAMTSDGTIGGRFFGYVPGNELKEVAAYTIEVEPGEKPKATLERVFERENIGEHNGRRSLSVGDVVELAGVRYAVEPLGFRPLDARGE